MHPPDTSLPTSLLQTIGNTTLLQLRHVVPEGHARVLIKLEAQNPTGSMKDRMALAMIEAAEADGRLQKGGSVVEYSTGSTGISLAFVCTLKGYPLSIVTSDAFSLEKRNHMRLLGAELTLVPSIDGGMTEALTLQMIEQARRIRQSRGSYWTNQLHNIDQVSGYFGLGEEIWRQTHGQVDAFVQSVGTAGSVRGTAMVLRAHHPGVHVVAVEPTESAVLSGGKAGVHRIGGIGAGFVVPLWEAHLIDEIETVSTEEAMTMARRLAREEALFSGPSTGCNVVAALRVAKRMGPEATVVTLMADTGLKYLSIPVYKQA